MDSEEQNNSKIISKIMETNPFFFFFLFFFPLYDLKWQMDLDQTWKEVRGINPFYLYLFWTESKTV